MNPLNRIREPRSPLVAVPLLSALAGALAVVSCGGGAPGGSQAAEGGVQKRDLPAVRVAPVEVREMARVLETTSKLESEREIEVVPRVSGMVLSLSAEEGDVVEQGAVLATLDDVEQALAAKDAEVALDEARNALDKLRLAEREADARVARVGIAFEQAARDHERNEKLFGDSQGTGERVASALSRSALEASKLARDNADADRVDAELMRERAKLELAAGQTAVERAEITLERARVTLGHTRITAPFAGVVAQRSIKVGDWTGPSTTAFVLTDMALLRCVFFRPQEELELFARVGGHNGDGEVAISATADAYPDRTFPGWIERISPTIDAQSGQFRVTGRLECVQDNGRVRLLPGMLVRLRIVTDRHPSALVVPKRAIEREGERRYLWVVREGLARRVEVEEGFGEDEWIEVLPGGGANLAAGDPVVVVGARELTDGDAVTVDAGPDAATEVAGAAGADAPPSDAPAPTAEASATAGEGDAGADAADDAEPE